MIESKLDVKTPDGIADCELYQPEANGQWPGVIVLTDIMGIREVFRDMSRKIAGEGYVVLLPNVYYRKGRMPLFDHPVSMQNEDDAKILRVWADELRIPGVMAKDGAALVDGLAALKNFKGKVGVVGYCMTGEMVVDAAAERPNLVAAAASYHGTALVKDADADSCHLKFKRAPNTRFYFGHATNDQSCPVEMIAKLDAAAKEQGADFKSEIYPGGHGFAVKGNARYDEPSCNMHWDTLLGLFKAKLK